ncbi:MAG: NAD(P)/FAD-dependent oxidoreductase [Aigarchaeota archaeon]|nr:NAD(P)/FAD-dependent oxidoreductase [Aigarchaeota archaeon]MDW8092862.1 NAD(P)/FAD-dependent oxidoreductase [Nitrososphaerota archaeon]
MEWTVALDEFDVAVIGGGPAGLIAARDSAKLGFDVVVFEENDVIGRPERCAGLYSVRGLRNIGISLTGRHVINEVYGAEIYSPGNMRAAVRTKRPVAVVASREELDRELARQALRAGAQLRIGRRVIRVERSGTSLLLRTQDGRVTKSRVVIDAEGHTAFIARQLFSDYRADGWLPIVQFLIRGHSFPEDRVYVWLRQYLRGFFGYVIPLNEEVARVGVASRRETMRRALKFLEEVAPRSKVIGYTSSCVYTGSPIKIGLRGNALLVGDVAGQVKPTTGGGVIIGGICAMKAVEHAYRLLNHGDHSYYERAVRHIYRELNRMASISRLLYSLNAKQLDSLIWSAESSGFTEELSRSGEMDFQSLALLRSSLSPSTLKFALYLLGKSVTD